MPLSQLIGQAPLTLLAAILPLGLLEALAERLLELRESRNSPTRAAKASSAGGQISRSLTSVIDSLNRCSTASSSFTLASSTSPACPTVFPVASRDNSSQTCGSPTSKEIVFSSGSGLPSRHPVGASSPTTRSPRAAGRSTATHSARLRRRSSSAVDLLCCRGDLHLGQLEVLEITELDFGSGLDRGHKGQLGLPVGDPHLRGSGASGDRALSRPRPDASSGAPDDRPPPARYHFETCCSTSSRGTFPLRNPGSRALAPELLDDSTGLGFDRRRRHLDLELLAAGSDIFDRQYDTHYLLADSALRLSGRTTYCQGSQLVRKGGLEPPPRLRD